MVKHSTGTRRSSTAKNNAVPQSQLSRLRDLSLLDSPPGLEQATPTPTPEFPNPGEGNLGFPDDVYSLAAAIFQKSHREKSAAHRLISYGKQAGRHLPEANDETTQRVAYELAFNALKYQELLEDIMIDSCFYLSQPMPDHQMSLVAVMLYDFQDRKFLPRERQTEEVIPDVRDVENCLLRFKTKLAASLARCRIKHDLLTIDCILPESVRQKQERASTLPLYTWVNTLQSSLDEVRGVLRRAGLSQVRGLGQLTGQVFCRDPHCEDTLVFPAPLREQLERTKLLRQHKLIMQDKSCILAACAVRPLLLEGDVLVVGSFSGLTVAHVASLVAQRPAGHGASPSKVYVCVGQRPSARRGELQETVAGMGCRNVKLIPESFLSLDVSDTRLQKVRVILLTPQCSVSAICNPVDFILQENGDPDLLQDLSHGSIAPAKLDALVAQQKKNIGHALRFSKVKAVVYATCSSYPQENEEVVMRALEQAPPPSPPPERADAVEGPKTLAFRPSSSLPMCLGCPEGCEGRVASPFFTLEPSQHSNGCFMAVLAREVRPEPVEAESVQEVLARAEATGLLDGIDQPTRKENRGRPNRHAQNGRTAQSRSHGNFASSQSRATDSLNRETKGSSSAPTFGRQKLANRQPSPRGKPKASGQRTFKPVPPSPALAPPKGRQEVLWPVALTLPPKVFPGNEPAPKQVPPPLPALPHSDTVYYQWKSEALAPQVLHSRSSGSVSVQKARSRPWF
ncbi:putative methyltransferase NSUN7 [Aplochiton taeniatus]